MKMFFKFIGLSRQEKKLIFQSIYYLGLFRLKLTTTAPRVLFLIVSKKTNYIAASHLVSVPPHTIARIINKTSRLIPCSTCLSKALAGYVLFAKNHYKINLHIGVRKNEKLELEAHAWLSCDGKIVLGEIPNLHRYHEFKLMN